MRRVSGGLGVLMVALAASAPALAQTAPGAAKLELKALPAAAPLTADGATRFRILASNGGTAAAENVTVRALRAGAAGIDWSLKPSAPRTVPAGSARTWLLAVEAPRKALGARKLQLLARYASGSPAKPGYADASIELQAPESVLPDDVAKLSLHATLTTLRSGASDDVYLQVDNKTAKTLHAGKVVDRTPGFLDVSGGQAGFDVPPGGTKLVALEVKADGRVRPGKHQLVFELPVEVGQTGKSVTLVAAQAVEIAVTGEDAFLTALGVPTLALIPGFLLIATMGLWWRVRWLRKKWDADTFPLEMKSAEFWVAAVTLSIVLVAAWLLVGVDLLGQYGLEDILWVWFGSLVLGTLFYVVWIAYRNHGWSKTTPTDGDDPLAVLDKLHAQKLNVLRPRYDHVANGVTSVLYELQPSDPKRPATWMSPGIDVAWDDDVDAELVARVHRDIDETRDAGALAATLREGIAGGKLAVKWSTDASPVSGPRLIDGEKIGTEKGLAAIVQEEA